MKILSVMTLALVLFFFATPAFLEQDPAPEFPRMDVDRETARRSVAEHMQSMELLQAKGYRPATRGVVGNIFVIEASRKSGTLVGPNKLDLTGKSVRFKRLPDGSYEASVSTSGLANPAGAPLLLQPGESRQQPLGFSFPFYRSVYKTVFVHATGNLTLGKAGKPPLGLTDLELFHLFPRVAPLDVFSLFSPAEVTIQQNSNQATFTWKILFDGNPFLFQATLQRSGDISFQYGMSSANPLAITGITPGFSTAPLPQYVDFTRSTVRDIRGAVVESFTRNSYVDPISIAKAFLSSQPDTFDMLVFFYSLRHPGRPSFPGTGVDVIYQNNIKGIGRSLYNYSRILGTQGRLKAIASLFDFEAYPADPRQLFRGYSADSGRTPLWLVSHEIAHYWLASVRIVENGNKTTHLLGDGCCHWNFAFDSDASFMYGNEIRDNGNGTFTTTEVQKRFSMLDQYLMGLVPATAVGPMFYVANPGVFVPSDYPKNNVTFPGTRVNVTMDQILAAEGPRSPEWKVSQHSYNVGFVLIVDEGRKPSQNELARLERLRAAWPAYFQEAAGNRIVMTTTLR